MKMTHPHIALLCIGGELDLEQRSKCPAALCNLHRASLAVNQSDADAVETESGTETASSSHFSKESRQG